MDSSESGSGQIQNKLNKTFSILKSERPVQLYFIKLSFENRILQNQFPPVSGFKIYETFCKLQCIDYFVFRFVAGRCFGCI